jgi:hypothetical protein
MQARPDTHRRTVRRSGGRRRTHARAIRLGAAAVVAASLARVGTVDAGRLPRYGGAVRVEVPLLPRDLDPLRLSGDVGAQLTACMYEGLTRWGPDGVQPALARKWIRSADSRRWVFYLHEDVVFHDGARCDAAAVQESLHRLADPGRSPYTWILRELVGWDDFAARRTSQIEGIYVVSPTEIELHFATAMPDVPELLANPAASVVRWQGLVPVGTGPYRAVGAVANALRLMAFSEHRDGRPFLDGIDFVTPDAPEVVALANTARMRRVDPAATVHPGMRRLRAPASRLGLALIHPNSAALGDRNTRRRLATGFDGGVFVRAWLSGDGEAASGFVPGGSSSREPGIEERDGDLFRRPEGHVRIVVPKGEPVLEGLGKRLHAHLFASGLDPKVQVLAPPTLDAAVRAGNYDVLLVGWTPPGPLGASRSEPIRVRDAATRLLQPILGVHSPDDLRKVLEDRGAPEESALLRSGHVVPLIFFHDAWEVSSHLADVRLAPHQADLGLTNAHLQPVTP